MARLGLPRSRRIKQGRDFSRIKVEGRRVVSGSLIANWISLPPGSLSRVGVVTPRRIGNAVARNRARRLLREAFRLHQFNLLKPVDMILVARQSISGKTYGGVEVDFSEALRRGGLTAK